MIKKLQLLQEKLIELGLVREADRCSAIIRLAKSSNTRVDPYDNISSPMDPVAWLDQECDHDFDADICPVCGKNLVE